MSADNGIKLIQLPDGKWVAKHYFNSLPFDVEIFIRGLTTLTPRPVLYPSLEAITDAYRNTAAETEYGFDIIYSKEYQLTTSVEGESFEQELTKLINKHSMENQSGTPDYILARFVGRQLWIFGETVQARASWRGESLELPTLLRQKEAGIESVTT